MLIGCQTSIKAWDGGYRRLLNEQFRQQEEFVSNPPIHCPLLVKSRDNVLYTGIQCLCTYMNLGSIV